MSDQQTDPPMPLDATGQELPKIDQLRHLISLNKAPEIRSNLVTVRLVTLLAEATLACLIELDDRLDVLDQDLDVVEHPL